MGRDLLEVIVFILLLILAKVVIFWIIHFVNPLSPPPRVGTAFGDVVNGIGAAVAVISYVGIVRFFEHRPVAEFCALSKSIRSVATGALLGVLLFSSVIVTLLITGHVHLSSSESLTTCGRAFLTALLTSILEETIFRGMLFRLLQRNTGTVPALVVSAAAFGLIHAGNPGATWLSSLAIALEAGLLLGAAYANTKTLWFPIGLHIGWNFTESGIFGADVSGYSIGGLFRSELSGPRWLTGGAFGPEAGLPAIIVCSLATVVLLKQLRLQPPAATMLTSAPLH